MTQHAAELPMTPGGLDPANGGLRLRGFGRRFRDGGWDQAGLGELAAALEQRKIYVDDQGRHYDECAPVRAEVVETLSSRPEAAAIDLLVVAAGDPSLEVRVRALQALQGRSEGHVLDAFATTAANAQGLHVAPQQQALEAQARALAVESLIAAADLSALDRVALRMVERPGDRDLDATDHHAFRSLAGALPVGAGVGVAGLLVGALADPRAHVRRRAAALLSWLEGPAVEPLIAALGTAGVTAKAAEILGDIGDARALEPLTAQLADPDPVTRAAVTAALGRISHPGAVEALLQVACDSDIRVRSAATAALDGLGTAAVVAALAGPLQALSSGLAELREQQARMPVAALEAASAATADGEQRASAAARGSAVTLVRRLLRQPA